MNERVRLLTEQALVVEHELEQLRSNVSSEAVWKEGTREVVREFDARLKKLRAQIVRDVTHQSPNQVQAIVYTLACQALADLADMRQAALKKAEKRGRA